MSFNLLLNIPEFSEETPDWAKRMTARFKALETHIEEIQIKMDTLTRTIKELRSATNNQQGTPSTDED
jgi:prefoldin subunit 5